MHRPRILRQPGECQTKKLIDAARYWATDGKISQLEQREQIAQDAKLFGIDPKELEEACRIDPEQENDDYEIWPENETVLYVFLNCGTQWRRVATVGGIIALGLDYPAVESTMRMLSIQDQEEVFRDLRVMEAAALEVMNARN